MQAKSLGQFLEKHIGWVLAIVAAVVGVFILLFVVPRGPEISEWHDIVRDIGIAFLVSAIVATIFEIHARSRFQIETIKGVFDVTMGEVSRPDIWEEVRKHVISKELVRERCDIHLNVIPGILGDIPGPTVLELIMSYDAHNMRSQKKTVTVRHAIDNHIRNDKHNLPCFTHIEVGEKIYSIPECLSKGKNGEIEWFTGEVGLEPKNAEPTRIIIGRKEITYIPGSYNFVMNEITKGITLHLMGLPQDIECLVNMRPHTSKEIPLYVNRILDRELQEFTLLPGHSIEFKFKSKGD